MRQERFVPQQQRHKVRASTCAAALLGALACASGVGSADASDLVRKAQERIDAGTVVPEVDLAPIFAALDRATRDGQAETLIEGIERLGCATGHSPAAVKAFVRQEAPPALLRACRRRLGWSVRGHALVALRALEADDGALREAIEIVRTDRSQDKRFLSSRADTLESLLQSRRDNHAEDLSLQPKGAVCERRSLAFLKERRVDVSGHALRAAVLEARIDVIEALLDAGVPVNPAKTLLGPLQTAAGMACVQAGPTLAERLGTIELLVARGADLEGMDALGNTVLMTTVQLCPLPFVRKLVELGANASPKPNAQDFTPLAMALVSGKWDVAEFLVERGARLGPAQINSIFFEKPTNSRVLAVLKRAQRSEAR